MTSRAARRANERDLLAGKAVAPEREHRKATLKTKPGKLRVLAFLVVALAILGGGVYLAGSVFMGQRDKPSTAGAIAMRVSMDGFDPNPITAKPGETLTIDWWNTDASMHLTNGVHSLVSDTLKVRFELPAQSRKTITITAPTATGDYDFWCDSCCGGKDNPKMHGTLHVEA
jgi:cytochrome c oxidase subunit 2